MTTNENANTETDTTDEDTRVIVLSGREITQRWDGLCWMTVSDKKAESK